MESQIILSQSQNPSLATLHFDGLIDYIRYLINQMQSGQKLTRNGTKYDSSTIRQYNAFLIHMEGFQSLHDQEFILKEVNYQFAMAFQSYVTDLGLAKNSVNNSMSKLKATLNEAFKYGLSLWNGSGISSAMEKTTQVYLTISELKKLREAKLTKGQEQVLDVFIIQCFTALRFDTCMKFLKNPLAYIQEDEGYSFIQITSDKTNEESLIPLGDTITSILEKNNFVFTIFSEQYYNRTLKTIGEKAEINQQIVTRKTLGGVMQENLVSKFSKLSSHTARRTLISLMRQEGFSNQDTMTISGHTTEKQLLTYDRSANLDKVKRLLGNDFFDTKI